MGFKQTKGLGVKKGIYYKETKTHFKYNILKYLEMSKQQNSWGDKADYIKNK